MSDGAQWWLVYVRWDNGHVETIRTTRPADVPRERCVVLACVLAPRVTFQAFRRW